MEVLPAWLDSVGMLLILELDRNRNQSPVAHTALGNDTPGEVPHIARGTFQNGDFQTTVQTTVPNNCRGPDARASMPPTNHGGCGKIASIASPTPAADDHKHDGADASSSE